MSEEESHRFEVKMNLPTNKKSWTVLWIISLMAILSAILIAFWDAKMREKLCEESEIINETRKSTDIPRKSCVEVPVRQPNNGYVDFRPTSIELIEPYAVSELGFWS